MANLLYLERLSLSNLVTISFHAIDTFVSQHVAVLRFLNLTGCLHISASQLQRLHSATRASTDVKATSHFVGLVPRHKSARVAAWDFIDLWAATVGVQRQYRCFFSCFCVLPSFVAFLSVSFACPWLGVLCMVYLV
jgi:hypothetical protein